MSLNSLVIPLRLLDIVPESEKNTYLGLLTSLGLLLAMVVQPIAGTISDRSTSRWGRRRPFILWGTVLALATLPGIGLSTTFVAILATYCLLQVFSNIAQGPFQGFIPDFIPRQRRGTASAIKSLTEISALAFLLVVAFLMDHYSKGQEQGWLWATLSFLSLMLSLAMMATMLLVKEQRHNVPSPSSWWTLPLEAFRIDLKVAPGFVWFLFSRLLVIMVIGIMQTYALYMLRDVFHISNLASAAAQLFLVIGGTIIIAVYLAGRLSDRLGRKPVLFLAGLLGSLAFLLLFFATTYSQILVFGGFLGTAIGAFLGTNWALATDLVPSGEEARYLGLTNLATAGASALARLSGPLVDLLNTRKENQGYSILLISCAVLFLLGSALVWKIREGRKTLQEDGPGLA